MKSASKLAALSFASFLFCLLLVGAGPEDGSKQTGKKEDTKGDVAKGKQVFEANCATCHEVTNVDKIGPGLKGISKKGRHTLATGIVRKEHGSAALRKQIVEGAGAMRPIGASLSKNELNDLIAYLMTL